MLETTFGFLFSQMTQPKSKPCWKKNVLWLWKVKRKFGGGRMQRRI